MKTIKFIKAHPVGIPVDKTARVDDEFAARMIREEYAVEIAEEEQSETAPEATETASTTVAAPSPKGDVNANNLKDGPDKSKRTTKKK